MFEKLLIGAYTNAFNKDGLHICQFNGHDQSIELLNLIDISNPSYGAITLNKKNIFVVNENHTLDDTLTSLLFDPESNGLTITSEISAGGSDPCYISVDSNANYVFVANYSSGTFCIAGIDHNGFLARPIQTVEQAVPDYLNSNKMSHVHATVLSPDERFLLVANLGLDTLTVYSVNVNLEKEPLDLNPFFVVNFSLGTGPRHLIFSDEDRYVIVVGELDATLHVLTWDNGRMEEKQVIDLMPKEYVGKNSAADIHFSPDNKFVYVSNRGDANQIIIFGFDSTFGWLTFIERISTNGSVPRNFAISPSGDFMLIAHQCSNEVRVFQIDKLTGLIQDLNKSYVVNSPVFVKFI